MSTAAPAPAKSISKSQFVDSTELLADPAALQARAAEDGYLFFKQRLPKDEVLAMRAEMLAVVEKHGWRQPGQDALGGLIDYDAINRLTEEEMHRTDVGVTADAYHDVQKLERFHRLPHHPRLLEIYRTLFGREVLVHPRHIARMVTPHTCMVPTPPHQDFPYIQGSAQTWTCWFPVGDCPKPLGGLMVLRGSHTQGYLPVQPARGAGGFAVPLCPSETEWMEGEYEAGCGHHRTAARHGADDSGVDPGRQFLLHSGYQQQVVVRPHRQQQDQGQREHHPVQLDAKQVLPH